MLRKHALFIGLSVVSAVLLTGCGGNSSTTGAAQYRSSDKDTGARDQAYRYCVRFAEDETLRNAGIDPLAFDAMNSDDPRAQMRAYDNKRTYQRILKDCMERRGFTRQPAPTQGLDDQIEGLRDHLRW